MYVVCFYWQGDRWQEVDYVEQDASYTNRQQYFIHKAGKVAKDLPAQYVNNLFKGVKRFATRPFKFICFTNEPLRNLHKEIEIRPFRKVSRMGVLPRLYVFSEEAGLFGSQVLCLDLDIVIVGSLENIMNYDGLFCARSKFKRGEEYKLDGDIFSFRAGHEIENIFWKPFIADVRKAERETEGRERYWFRQVAGNIAERWDVHAPGQVVSYKRHVSGLYPYFPTRAAIISCHGTPRPHQVNKKWFKQYWK